MRGCVYLFLANQLKTTHHDTALVAWPKNKKLCNQDNKTNRKTRRRYAEKTKNTNHTHTLFR